MKTYRKNHWLNVLSTVEKELPSLLMDKNRWNSVFVDYEKPFVERLWTTYGNMRIYLHKIHATGSNNSLFHPHPWPSAIRIVGGSYQMDVGYGTGESIPPIAATIILPAGSTYEMIDPDGWHSVAPIDEPSYTIMITGTPWERESPKSDYKLRELTQHEKEDLFRFFKKYYK